MRVLNARGAEFAALSPSPFTPNPAVKRYVQAPNGSSELDQAAPAPKSGTEPGTPKKTGGEVLFLRAPRLAAQISLQMN